MTRMLGGWCGDLGVDGPSVDLAVAEEEVAVGVVGAGCWSTAEGRGDMLRIEASSAMASGMPCIFLGLEGGSSGPAPSTWVLGMGEGARGKARGTVRLGASAGASPAAPALSSSSACVGRLPPSMMLPRLEKDMWVMKSEKSPPAAAVLVLLALLVNPDNSLGPMVDPY